MNFNFYKQVFLNSWQAKIIYRANTYIRMLFTAIGFIAIVFLWQDIFQNRATLGGYDFKDIITYYLLVTYLMNWFFAGLGVASAIQEGGLSQMLTKPVSYIFYIYADAMATRIFRALFTLPALVVVFYFARDYLVLPSSPLTYLYTLVVIIGGLNILFLIDFLLECIEFWIFGSMSINFVASKIIMFFAGSIIPLFLLPDIVQAIANALPFKYTGFFVVDTFLGKSSSQEILYGLGIQAIWIISLFSLLMIIWNRGLKRYEAVGG